MIPIRRRNGKVHWDTLFDQVSADIKENNHRVDQIDLDTRFYWVHVTIDRPMVHVTNIKSYKMTDEDKKYILFLVKRRKYPDYFTTTYITGQYHCLVVKKSNIQNAVMVVFTARHLLPNYIVTLYLGNRRAKSPGETHKSSPFALDLTSNTVLDYSGDKFLMRGHKMNYHYYSLMNVIRILESDESGNIYISGKVTPFNNFYVEGVTIKENIQIFEGHDILVYYYPRKNVVT